MAACHLLIILRGAMMKRSRTPHRSIRRKAVIYTNGEVTEHSYLQSLRSLIRNQRIEIRLESTSPLRMVNKAIRDRKRDRRNVSAPEDLYAVVFDHDNFDCVPSACSVAEENGFLVADSEPCFEYWLILHFTRYNRPGNASELKRDLLKHDPDFSKEKSKFHSTSYIEKLPNALANLQARKKDAEYPCNPSSNMDLLIKGLESL